MPQNRSIELGGSETIHKDLLNREFEPEMRHTSQDNQLHQHSNSPPLVASKISSLNDSSLISQNPSASDLQNLLSSPQYKASADLKGFGKKSAEKSLAGDLADSKPIGSPKQPKQSSKSKEFGEKAPDQSQGEGDENDSFHRLYNKEIKVNQDEIPLLLLELTDIAYKFIKKEQFEKAYVLLQKTESVLEVVNLEHSKRDRYFAYITYMNMAMCFQKLGMLEECIIYLKETIQVIEKPGFFKDVSISQRMKQMHMQCQLKLQLCAILSQTQKHTEAMDNAKTSVRLAHQILRDMYDLCVFYSNKIKFKDDFASLSLLLMDESEENNESKAREQSKYYTDALAGDSKQVATGGKPPKHTKSEINEKFNQKQFIRENSPVRDIPYNILEESISMIERTALKLLPIMKELGNRLAGTVGKKGLQAFNNMNELMVDSVDTKNLSVQKASVMENIRRKKALNDKGLLVDQSEEQDIKDLELEIKENAAKKDTEKEKADQIDMRTILGFLNQNEWISNLNIGNIMQIQPIRMRDFLTFNRNEHQLSRESFLEKLQVLVVAYFCVSTELRFIVQSRAGFMKAETKKEKELEQEYWHVKALDIACAFLPSECPLFNHILLSYQKHHDPTMAPIEEDKEADDNLKVLRPLKGIENSKHQPIVREVENVYVEISEIPMSPLSKCFDHRLMPKKIKTTSMNIQTDPMPEPELPQMKSMNISVQNDLHLGEEKEIQTITQNEVFDNKNAYMDLSSSKYQEKMISQILEDPKLDKEKFLNKLLSRVNSETGGRFMPKGANRSQHVYQDSGIDRTNANTTTLSDHPTSGMFDDAIYGQGRSSVKPSKHTKHGLLANRKNTQSNQLSFKKGKHNQTNFEELHAGGSFDHKVKNHVRSMYGDVNSSVDEKTAIGCAKHHIASQSLAPTNNVLTDQKIHRGKGTGFKHNSIVHNHKKNQSISGGGSTSNADMFTSTKINKGKQTMDINSLHRQFNNSLNSNLSKGTRVTKKNMKEGHIKTSATSKILKTVDTKINLSNQKSGGVRKPTKYHTNTNYRGGGSKEREKSGGKNKLALSKKATTLVHNLPAAKNEDSLMHGMGDMMSDSSYDENNCSSPMSGADPDLLNQIQPSQPEDSGSVSELNKTKSIISDNKQATLKNPLFQKTNEELQQISQTHEQPHRGLNASLQGKQRPSSAITNYTSGTSAMRTKAQLRKVQEEARQKHVNKQIQRLQQSQNIIKNQKQQRQKHEGAPLVPKKKSKVLSRKKYGSDHSSTSPPHVQQHGYSIAQGPFSIFDSNGSHSISKFSNLQQSKQSIQEQQQLVQYMNQERINMAKGGQTQQTQVQSQNILNKLQNLLVNKRSEAEIPKAKKNKQTLNQANSINRKQAHSIGSLGYSQGRKSRYSQNSQSRKSKVSRSKSSGKSTGKAHRSVSNERSKLNLNNQKEMNVSPLINQSQNFLDSDIEAKNHAASFELNYLLQEMNKHQQSAPEVQKRRKNNLAQKQRPKSTLQIDNRESMNSSKLKKAAKGMGMGRAQLNHSLENLQRQVIENQKILMMNQKSSTQTKRHNHNNSLCEGGSSNLMLMDEAKYSSVNQAKPNAPMTSTSQAKKRTATKKKGEKQSRLNNQSQYNTSQTGIQMAQNLIPSGKQKSGNLSLKMTQQHLSQGLKQFTNMMGAASTTASTNNAANNFQSGKSMKSRKTLNQHKRKSSQGPLPQKHNGQFVNFEQMQQQLEGQIATGGFDMQQKAALAAAMAQQMNEPQHMSFVPHKNLMPKTTGSQAHLLNIQQQQQQEAASSVHAGLSGCKTSSMNQTGRTSNSLHGKRKQKPQIN